MGILAHERLQKINENYAPLKKTRWFLPHYFWITVLLISGICFPIADSKIIEILAVMVSLYCIAWVKSL